MATVLRVATPTTLAKVVRPDDCIVCVAEKPSGVIHFQESCNCNPVIHPECLHDWLEKNSDDACALCKKSVTEAFEREKGHKKFRFYCNICYGGSIAASLLIILLVFII